MRINNKLLKFGLGALSLLIISLAGVATAVRTTERQMVSLKDIEHQCSGRLDADGFGKATIKASHIKDQTGTISVPCKLTLKNGATLQLTNVTLQTKNLLIQSSESADTPSHVVINKSTLRSSNGGFQIQFKAPGSSTSINNSTLDYPLSIGVAVGSGDDDTTSSLRVGGSNFNSKSPESEGIILVSTGKAVVKDNIFSFADNESQALLLGSSCQLTNNKNANTRCHGP